MLIPVDVMETVQSNILVYPLVPKVILVTVCVKQDMAPVMVKPVQVVAYVGLDTIVEKGSHVNHAHMVQQVMEKS